MLLFNFCYFFWKKIVSLKLRHLKLRKSGWALYQKVCKTQDKNITSYLPFYWWQKLFETFTCTCSIKIVHRSTEFYVWWDDMTVTKDCFRPRVIFRIMQLNFSFLSFIMLESADQCSGPPLTPVLYFAFISLKEVTRVETFFCPFR